MTKKKRIGQECLVLQRGATSFSASAIGAEYSALWKTAASIGRLRGRYRAWRVTWINPEHLRARRPRMIDLPEFLVPFELLFQVTLRRALDDARQMYGQIISELETIVAEYLSSDRATVADSLAGTNRVYSTLSIYLGRRFRSALRSGRVGSGR